MRLYSTETTDARIPRYAAVKVVGEFQLRVHELSDDLKETEGSFSNGGGRDS